MYPLLKGMEPIPLSIDMACAPEIFHIKMVFSPAVMSAGWAENVSITGRVTGGGKAGAGVTVTVTVSLTLPAALVAVSV